MTQQLLKLFYKLSERNIIQQLVTNPHPNGCDEPYELLSYQAMAVMAP